jgi:hypothetical protein
MVLESDHSPQKLSNSFFKLSNRVKIVTVPVDAWPKVDDVDLKSSPKLSWTEEGHNNNNNKFYS